MDSGNITAILVAVFAGALASLATGYFSRPKTKAEAKKENATADVTMSGDAREWAQFWAQKAQEAEKRADDADARAEAAEIISRRTVANMEMMVDYTLSLEHQVVKDGHILPPITEAVRFILHGVEPTVHQQGEVREIAPE